MQKAAGPLRLLLLLATLWPGAALGAAPKPAPDPAIIVRQVVTDLDIQDRLPEGKPKPPVPADANGGNWNISPTLGWSVLIVGGFLLLLAFLFAFRDSLVLRRRGIARQSASTPVATTTTDSAPMIEAQSDADRLAAEGRFAEAMHTLLLQTLAELRSRLAQGFAPSLTSREVARAVSIPDSARLALQGLVGKVEPIYFGNGSAEAADYASCRAFYSALMHDLFPAPSA
jgi:hypothetical protein